MPGSCGLPSARRHGGFLASASSFPSPIFYLDIKLQTEFKQKSCGHFAVSQPPGISAFPTTKKGGFMIFSTVKFTI